MFGLPGETVDLINEVFSGYPKIEKVFITALEQGVITKPDLI